MELLGVPEIGLDDDFFDLGGDSLLAIRILSRLKEEHGVSDTLAGLLSANTVRKLAARVRELSARDAPEEAVPAQAAFEEFRL